MAVRVQLIQKNIQKLLERIGATELTRRAENVLAEAKRLAPVADGSKSNPGSHPGPSLRDSLVKTTPKTTRDGVQIRIFSNARTREGIPLAKIITKGSRPHPIVGRGKNLVFQWIKGGVLFVGPRVDHPGQKKPNEFLREALKAFRR
jgi:bacteriophage HK97-gp10 putative tail-component